MIATVYDNDYSVFLRLPLENQPIIITRGFANSKVTYRVPNQNERKASHVLVLYAFQNELNLSNYHCHPFSFHDFNASALREGKRHEEEAGKIFS